MIDHRINKQYINTLIASFGKPRALNKFINSVQILYTNIKMRVLGRNGWQWDRESNLLQEGGDGVSFPLLLNRTKLNYG